jgi:DNA-nicking Smr family endonuclease
MRVHDLPRPMQSTPRRPQREDNGRMGRRNAFSILRDLDTRRVAPPPAPKPEPPAPPPETAPAIDPDVQLFLEAIGPVRMLKSPDVAVPPLPKPAPEPRQQQADEARVIEELLISPLTDIDIDGTEALAYLRDGASPKLLRQLKRGQYTVQAELDLHLMRQHEAQQALSRFLAEARDHGCLSVRIIHGKGRSSDRGPVLKALCDRWLRQRADVLAFCSAAPREGGTGAVLVLLARR